MTPEEALASSMARLPDRAPGAPLAVAVSGGGDSMALLHVAAKWARGHASPLSAVTVDHGLRTAATQEAAEVARVCASLAVPHATLRWSGWDGRGNLQDRARRARRELIADWAAGLGIRHVLLGHTADDQAETVLLRLARGSGVDGLAGMREIVQAPPGWWARPLLRLSRATLRDWLRVRNLGWIEDPSNEDARFDRVRARRMLDSLEALGLTRTRLIRTADHMRRAQASLQIRAQEVAREAAQVEGADLKLPVRLLAEAEDQDVAGRLLAAALGWVGNNSYRPRHDALLRLARAVVDGRAATLAGCRMLRQGDWVRITREARALSPHVSAQAGGAASQAVRWDGRWLLGRAGPGHDPDDDGLNGLQVGALGLAGLRACPSGVPSGLRPEALQATPAVWQGERLVAAPLAGWPQGWTAALDPAFPDHVRGA